jgi:ABC-type multidrug transport system permease subunit
LVTTIAVVTTKVEKEKAETIISITGGHRVIQQATNLVEVLLSKFYCCAYTSFDIDLQQIIIEYLQCIEFASPLRKFHMNTPPPFYFLLQCTNNSNNNNNHDNNIDIDMAMIMIIVVISIVLVVFMFKIKSNLCLMYEKAT